MSTADSKSHLVLDLGDFVPPSAPLSAPSGGLSRVASDDANRALAGDKVNQQRHASSLELAAGPSADARPARLSRHQSGPVYLDGDVLACACPECGSPMSIRLWLMLADCWHCGTSVELTEEQEREAQRLLAERQQAPPAANAAGPWAQPVVARPPAVPPHAAPRTAPPDKPSPPAIPPAPPKPAKPVMRTPSPAAKTFAQAAPPTRRPARPATAAAPAQRVRKQLESQRTSGFVRRVSRGVFKTLPAWLTSLILHMVAMILLGIWMNPVEREERSLILATQVGPEDQAGGIDEIARSDDPESFQDPGDLTPRDVEASEALKNESESEFESIAEQLPIPLESPEAPSLLLQPSTLPITASQGVGSIYLGRDPKARASLVRSSGGTIASEAAVARGLEWLSWHQNKDGSWSLDQFHKAGKCNGRCSHVGQQCDTAGTALALLPFLGAGQTHQEGKYTDVVRRGLVWLVKNQKSDGNLWTGGMQLSQMYAHGQATIALCEAFALTQDSYLRAPAQAALEFIVKAQHSAGGWRYYPGAEGDTSVVGWQIMALRSGQLGGLEVPAEAFELASRFLNSVQDDTTGARYGYQPAAGFSPTMTAEALLCRQYAGWPRNHPGLVTGTRELVDKHAPRTGPSNMYYWYYATQVMHHLGGAAWKDWNGPMRDLLVNSQETKGHQAGSWQPTGNFDPAGGRLYMTALAVCTLEVYYRHMPLYQDAALEKDVAEKDE